MLITTCGPVSAPTTAFPSGSNLPLLSGKDELEKWFYNLKK